MTPNLRRQRSAFLLFLGACFVALMTALPIVTAQTARPQEEGKQQPDAGGASAPSLADAPDFERADRNKDGYVDKSEAGAIPGLSANFERADRSKDGRLDRDEFAHGLRILQVRR